MPKGIKIYRVAPRDQVWSATVNERVVFQSPSKAQVVSLVRHAAQANAPSSVVVAGEDGDIEHEWSFSTDQPIRRLVASPATA